MRTTGRGAPSGISDEAMREILRVAAVCESWERLDDYLRSIELGDDAEVAFLDGRRQRDAARRAFARAVFEEVREA